MHFYSARQAQNHYSTLGTAETTKKKADAVASQLSKAHARTDRLALLNQALWEILSERL